MGIVSGTINFFQHTLPAKIAAGNKAVENAMTGPTESYYADPNNGAPGLEAEAKLAALGKQSLVKAGRLGKNDSQFNKEEAIKSGLKELKDKRASAPATRAVLRASGGVLGKATTEDQVKNRRVMQDVRDSGPANMRLVNLDPSARQSWTK